MTTRTEPLDRELTANNLRFHYREWGDSGAPAVLVLHGISGHSWEWDAVCRGLADEFHVVAVDQRGHGASDRAPTYAPAEMAEDIGAIIDALGLGRVRIVGHSMGGINSYLFAARNPDAVERLVIADIGPDAFTPESCDVLRGVLDHWAQSAFVDPEEAFAEWRVNSPLSTDDGLHRYVDHNLRQREDGKWVWRFDARGLVSFVEHLPPAEEQWEALRRIDCPALILRGSESDHFPAAGRSRMVREMRDANFVEIPGAGHDVHLDQPDLTLDAVQRFLTAD